MLAKRLKQLRQEANLSQAELGKIFGKAPSAISMWESGMRQPGIEQTQRIADYFGVSLDYLMGNTDIRNSDSLTDWLEPELKPVDAAASLCMVNIVANVKAGPGGVPTEELQGTEYAHGISDPSQYRFLRVEGTSMSPRIEPGDLALVHLQNDVDSGQLAVIIINNEEAVIKKVVKDDSTGSISLVSFNPDFPPRIFVGPQREALYIYGRVTEITRSFS